MDFYEDVCYVKANKDELAPLCERYGITIEDGDAPFWRVKYKIATPVKQNLNIGKIKNLFNSASSFRSYLFEDALVNNKIIININSSATYLQICDTLSLLGFTVVKDPLYFDDASYFCLHNGQLLKSFEVGLQLISYLEGGYTFLDNVFLDEINAYLKGYDTFTFIPLLERNEVSLYE